MRLHPKLLGSAIQYWLAAQSPMPRLPQSVWVGAGGVVAVGVGHFFCIHEWTLMGLGCLFGVYLQLSLAL